MKGAPVVAKRKQVSLRKSADRSGRLSESQLGLIKWMSKIYLGGIIIFDTLITSLHVTE